MLFRSMSAAISEQQSASFCHFQAMLRCFCTKLHSGHSLPTSLGNKKSLFGLVCSWRWFGRLFISSLCKLHTSLHLPICLLCRLVDWLSVCSAGSACLFWSRLMALTRKAKCRGLCGCLLVSLVGESAAAGPAACQTTRSSIVIDDGCSSR